MDRRRAKKSNDAQILLQDNIMLRTINAELRVEIEQRLLEAYQERDHYFEAAQVMEQENHEVKRRYEAELGVRLYLIKAIERYRSGCAAGDPLAS